MCLTMEISDFLLDLKWIKNENNFIMVDNPERRCQLTYFI